MVARPSRKSEDYGTRALSHYESMCRANKAPACVSIGGVRLPLLTTEQALDRIMCGFGARTKVLFFVNAHTAFLALQDVNYGKILQSADVLLNDGVGLSVAARLRGSAFPADLPGNVIIPALLNGDRLPRPTRLFLLGGDSEVVQNAARRAAVSFRTIEIVGAHHGYFAVGEEGIVIAAIQKARPHVLLVGLGNPKQEHFIARHRDRFRSCLVAGVGGLIDIWGGRLRDYPRWSTVLRLHWLLRLCQEPRRLAGRYLLEVPQLWVEVCKQTMRGARVDSNRRRPDSSGGAFS